MYSGKNSGRKVEKVTREERVLRTISRQEIDYLPSQIYFASQTTKEKLQNVLGLASPQDLEAYLDNHLYLTFTMDDVFRYREDHELLKRAEAMGFARVDWERGIVYDRWGIGFDMYSDGFCIRHFPLQDEDALKKFEPPDPTKPGLLTVATEDLKRYSGDYLVVCTGYHGILEKAWGLRGFEAFMLDLALGTKDIERLLDAITEYKVEVARQVVQAGFRCGHTGDDFGTQRGLLISRDTWRKYFKPRWAKVWRVYKDAGLPVIHHSCGNITEIIGDMIDIGLDVLEPVQPVMDLAYLKREFGKYITFYGGIDTQELLPYGTPDEVKTMARETIRTLGKGGGLIISPAQEIMRDVPIENVVALVEVIREEREAVLKESVERADPCGGVNS
uniref:Uroporphyrinogen decarboxylase (URO-D) domain-containing protein n=1 Tax=Candidatus Caldatribacterium saccharofermentans TaxID=1454753 RepID=A0A7V4WLL4_9BACT